MESILFENGGNRADSGDFRKIAEIRFGDDIAKSPNVSRNSNCSRMHTYFTTYKIKTIYETKLLGLLSFPFVSHKEEDNFLIMNILLLSAVHVYYFLRY